MVEAKPFQPGSVVRNRGRLWRVDELDVDVLIATSIDGGQTEQHEFYLPFEDITPAQLDLPSQDKVGAPQSQDLLLRAHRLSMMHGSAPLVSLQRSRVIPTEYQLVPVVMALNTPRVRLLIADDVGLGKTVEAGLVVTELLSRQMARNVLVVCPANLREQWRGALEYFFHLDAKIVSSRHRRALERNLPAGANPWEFYRYFVTSLDYAKTPAIRNQLLEQEWDIVLVDEGHLIAKPHQASADQHVDMERWRLGEALAEKARHLLLLTATPHNGYTDSFASLLSMLGVGATSGPRHEPRIHRGVAENHVCQRRRKDVEEWFERSGKKSPFPRKDQDEVIVQPTSYEREAISAVQDYGNLVLRSAQSGARQPVMAYWTVMHLHKRALSSPEALRVSLKNRREALERRLAGSIFEDDESGISTEAARSETLDEDTGERLSDEEAGRRMERAAYGTPEAIREELMVLGDVEEAAKQVTPTRDGKLQELLKNELRRRLATSPKCIIFTRYTDTMEYLTKQIERSKRYEGVEVVTIHGSLNERQRRERFLAFERATRAVLVATDAISEGINLQHAASQVVHYELPWNPNRLEQRNGRVDRFGQREPVVYLRTMVMDETLDAAILKVLVEKAAKIRADYGFAPPYFGDETNVLDLIREQGFATRLAPQQLGLFDAPDDARTEAPDPFSEETVRRIEGESFYGQTHIRLPEVEERLRETELTIGSPRQVQAFVVSGLLRFGCGVTDNGDETYRIALTNPVLRTPPIGDVVLRATFDAQKALDDPDVVALDLGHPLVRRLLDVIKQEAFLGGDHYGRASALTVREAEEVTAVFHLLARYVVGTEPRQIIEELIPAGTPVYGDGRLEKGVLASLLNAEPVPGERTSGEVREELEEVLTRPNLETCFERAVGERMRELVEERSRLRDHLTGGDHEMAWLKGIDDLAPAAYDVLAVTIYYPGV
jgi:superfamily II DNA or RNA helicase